MFTVKLSYSYLTHEHGASVDVVCTHCAHIAKSHMQAIPHIVVFRVSALSFPSERHRCDGVCNVGSVAIDVGRKLL